MRNDSVFPEPVPVVTIVGSGAWPDLLDSRCQAVAWWV